MSQRISERQVLTNSDLFSGWGLPTFHDHKCFLICTLQTFSQIGSNISYLEIFQQNNNYKPICICIQQCLLSTELDKTIYLSLNDDQNQFLKIFNDTYVLFFTTSLPSECEATDAIK